MECHHIRDAMAALRVKLLEKGEILSCVDGVCGVDSAMDDFN